MAWNNQEFLEFAVENNVVGVFENPVKLKCGRLSPYYINWRRATNYAKSLTKLGDYVSDLVMSDFNGIDTIFGVPEGATKTGIVSQIKFAEKKGFDKDYVVAMGRGKVKDHGLPEDRFFVGAPVGKTVLVEDVVTTGSSLLEWVEKLEEVKNCQVVGCVVLTDREEVRDDGKTVKECIEEKGIKYCPLSTSKELLKMIEKDLDEERKRQVRDYFEKYTKVTPPF